jgi:hypothetical protein
LSTLRCGTGGGLGCCCRGCSGLESGCSSKSEPRELVRMLSWRSGALSGAAMVTMVLLLLVAVASSSTLPNEWLLREAARLLVPLLATSSSCSCSAPSQLLAPPACECCGL